MQESYSISVKSKIGDSSKNEAKSKDLFLERFVSIFPVPYYWGWAIFSGIVFLCSSMLIFYLENSFSYLPSLLFLSILIAQEASIVIWAHKKMKGLREYLLDIIDLPKDDVLRWYDNQMTIIFNELRMFASGILVTIFVHLMGLDQFGFSFQSHYSGFIIKIDYIFAHVLMGVGLYPLICTAIMVHKIGEFPLNTNIIFSRNVHFKGLLYSKFTLCATSVYIVWGCFHLSTPEKLSTPWSIAWFSFFGLLLLAYFILPQYDIHQMMIKTRKEKLGMFSSRLMTKAEEVFSSPNKENVFCLRNYLDIEHQLDDMCVWPFGSYELLHIILIVIIPFLVVLLEIVFGILK